MGVVYAAHDTELQRAVAIKLVRPTAPTPTQALGQAATGATSAAPPERQGTANLALPTPFATLRSNARVRTEARALARVHHRNVVAIHDVGTLDGMSYIVMERIDGETLADWLKHKPLVAMVRAMLWEIAQGVTAAHACGVLHRDIKPSNVLVTQGRAVVIDFGVAALRDNVQGCAGTPAYMAPEVLRGEPATARSDVYSFSCMAYECFVGKLPFTRQALATATATAAAASEPSAAPSIATLQATLARVISKPLATLIIDGLRTDPTQRPESMQAFATALAPPEAQPTPTWRRAGVLAGSIAAVAGLGGATWWHFATSAQTQRSACEATQRTQANALWAPLDDIRLTVAFAGSQQPFARAAAASVQRQAQRWRDDFMRLRIERCALPAAATSPATHRCLDQLRAAAQAQLQNVMLATPFVVEHAVANVFALPAPTLCLQQPEQLAVALPSTVPASIQQRINRMRDAISRGATSEATQAVDAILSDPAWQSTGPHQAFVYYAVGDVLSRVGQRATEAQRYLAQAAQLADTHRQDYLRADAQLLAAHSQITHAKDAALAQAALSQAETAIARAGNPPELRQRAAVTRATFLMQTGDNASAVRILAPLVASEALAPASPTIATHLDLYGNSLQRGQPAAAAVAFARAAEMWTQLFGPDHPDTAIALTGLAGALFHQGKLTEAVRAQQRAVTAAAKVLKPNAPLLRTMRSNLANVLMEAGQFDAAVREHQALVALAQHERAPGDRTLELRFAQAQLDLAAALTNAERNREALPLVEDSVALYTRHRVPTPMLVRAQYVQAGIYANLNHISAAIATLDRTLTLLGPDAGVERAAPLFMLAQLYAETQPKRARALAATAAQLYRDSGNTAGTAEITAWLTTQFGVSATPKSPAGPERSRKR